jgi:hypothetical protein
MRDPDKPIPFPPYQDTPAPSPKHDIPDEQEIYKAEYEARVKKEIEDLKRKIGRFFTVYEVHVGLDAVAFHLRVNEETLEENFENLRNLLKPEYIPVLTYEGGEHILFVTRKPKVKYKGTRVNLILLIITIFTTTIAGSSLWLSYDTVRQGLSVSEIDVLASLFSPSNLFFGALFFSLPLLLILGTHETSHYIMAKKHGVAASLPFFIPMAPPLGTLGAVISMREPIPNKKALIDIGAAGPIGGLLIAIPVTIVGLFLTDLYSVSAQSTEPGGMILYNPILIIGLGSLLPTEGNLLAHPTFFAGWVGILVTALNLLPAGQLDGGHIVRALFGKNARTIGIATVVIMLFLGLYFNYFGYVFLIIIIMVLGGGLSHPPPLNDITKLDKRRVMVGVLAMVIFVVSFHPAPFQTARLPNYGFELNSEFNETSIAPGSYMEFNITIENIGSIENDAYINTTLNETLIALGWNATITWIHDETYIYYITDTEPLEITLDEDEQVNMSVTVTSPSNASIGENLTLKINLKWFSWGTNDLGDVEKRERRTHEEIIVKVE